jgi:hypothetical protein
MRTGAAVSLVVVLAIGWVVTTRRGSGAGRAEAAVTEPTASTASPTPTTLPAEGDTTAGVVVRIERMPPEAVTSAYLAAIGAVSTTRGTGRGAPACSRGGEEERAWSFPTRPRRSVGRYACRIEQGRAAMWWTVDGRGIVAHAVATDADLGSLFAWWESHPER